MLLESREGIKVESVDERITNYYGSLTVSGSGNLKIPCRGRPWEVEVGFSDQTPPPPGCGPVLQDTVDIAIVSLIDPFPLWAIQIAWDVHSGNIREIVWRAAVVNQ